MFTATLKTKVAAESEQSKHQAILNIAYNDWQREDNNWGYAQMLKNAEKKYGELAMFAVLVGKYNQQVCNGGHSQYWCNGYASAKTDGFGTSHDDSELHEELMDLLSKHGLRVSTKHGEAVYQIMTEFLEAAGEVDGCFECDGSGHFEAEDEDGSPYEEECCTCRGTGVDENTIGDTDHLDTRYYAISEAWEAELEEFFKNAL